MVEQNVKETVRSDVQGLCAYPVLSGFCFEVRCEVSSVFEVALITLWVNMPLTSVEEYLLQSCAPALRKPAPVITTTLAACPLKNAKAAFLKRAILHRFKL